MASHSPGPVPDPWDRSPHCPSSANHWRIQQRSHQSHSAKDRQRASGQQSIPATGCLPSTGQHGPLTDHSRRLAVLPPKPWMRAPASPSEYHPASSPSKIAQSERTGNERLWYHRRHFARKPCQWQPCETPVPCWEDPPQYGNIETLGCVAHTPAPWPRFLSPGNARHAHAALDGAAWSKNLLSQA